VKISALQFVSASNFLSASQASNTANPIQVQIKPKEKNIPPNQIHPGQPDGIGKISG
jgi:hypothetical protein